MVRGDSADRRLAVDRQIVVEGDATVERHTTFACRLGTEGFGQGSEIGYLELDLKRARAAAPSLGGGASDASA